MSRGHSAEGMAIRYAHALCSMQQLIGQKDFGQQYVQKLL